VEHGVGPPTQVGQPGGVGVAVQADPVRGGGATSAGNVERVRDGLGQFLESCGEIEAGLEAGLVEPFVDGVDLAAEVGDLHGQRGQALAQSAGRRVSRRVGGHDDLPSSSAYR
jgi:hypothetical protein